MSRKWMLLSISVLLVLLSSCGGASGGTNVWIDVPLNPTSLGEVQTVSIEGHASSPEGIAQIEVWVNGSLIQTITNPITAGNLATFESQFTPAGPGEYTIQVVATGVNGFASEPDVTVVMIGESQAAAPDGTAPPTATFTPTPTATLVPVIDPDEPYINYYAHPEAIIAGGCTTIHWEIANVSQVEFGGSVQPLNGSYYDCMCESQTYPLTVTYTDGSTETFRLTIPVEGDCDDPPPTPTFTPTPIPPDTTPPGMVNLLKPLNNTTLPSSTSEVILRWEAASDPSGIEEYRVEVQRHPGDNNWQPVSGSTFIVHGDTNLTLSTGSAYTYRWRVAALDGAGNLSAWSGWFTFTVTLG